MTWTAQQRHKARAVAVAEPYRRAAVLTGLRDALRTGGCVFVRTDRIAGSSAGRVIELGDGYVVIDGAGITSNIPLKHVTAVEPC